MLPSVPPRRLLVLGLLALGTPLGTAQSLRLDPAGAEPIRFGPVGEFSFLDSRGETVTDEDLLGSPWVGMLFFTRCAGPCPRLVADTRALLAEELAGSDVRIVSFTVDPEHDRPEVLAEYAGRYDVDPEQWLFLTGEEQELHRFVKEGLKLAVEGPELRVYPGGDEEGPGSAGSRLSERLDITHATRLVAVDPAGSIAGYYEVGSDVRATREEIEAGFERLRGRLGAIGRGEAPRSVLPLVNASLNGLAFLLLLWGYAAIKAGRRELHGKVMGAAFVVSALFLACYLYYHFAVLPISGGPTRYNGTGLAKTLYLAMLLSHVVLAAVNLPMVLRTLWLAHRQDWERHRRMARWTFPIWLYVSITGVLVYLVLYPFNPPAA